MNTNNPYLRQWIEEVASHTKPDNVIWCDDTEEYYQSVIAAMQESGDLHALNSDLYPNCYLYRSHPDDVARAEHLTIICTKHEEDAGPNNHWLSPADGHARVDALFAGCMAGRTMYVIPYCMGPYNSPFAQFGVEITDSLYVVLNMRIMTRIGQKALSHIDRLGENFVRGLHSVGDLSPDRRWIMHFPEEMMIKSIGSGYGGNALLGKKCHALRLASWQGYQQGWLAEHMLIAGIENPEGERYYIAAAFPSACGKTNLAMLIPPEAYPGWKVWTVGDDIAWLRVGEDGRLWAMNPESGFFGVAPGTSPHTNPHAFDMLKQNAIFTNVALTEDNQPWWEDKDKQTPVIDWKGQPYDANSTHPAAHPNARFTVSCRACPSYDSAAEASYGVPISAILFGSRRASLVPLVYEAYDWAQGVLAGASMCSETTAAATAKVGQLRRDPMAMKPFCGYHYGDYMSHWLSVGERLSQAPKIFHVNWFRQDDQGRFLWPGFRDNIRVLEWIISRCKGAIDAHKTPIGYMPNPKDIYTEELEISAENMEALLSLDHQAYAENLKESFGFFQDLAPRVPKQLLDVCESMISELEQKT